MNKNELWKVKADIMAEEENQKNLRTNSSYSRHWKFSDSALGATVSQATSRK